MIIFLFLLTAYASKIVTFHTLIAVEPSLFGKWPTSDSPRRKLWAVLLRGAATRSNPIPGVYMTVRVHFIAR